MFTLRHRAAALVTTAALAAAPIALTGGRRPRRLTGSRARSPRPQRAATIDQVHALQRQLAGHHLSASERVALRAATAELRTALQDGHLTPAARKAKRAEYVALVKKLHAADARGAHCDPQRAGGAAHRDRGRSPHPRRAPRPAGPRSLT